MGLLPSCCPPASPYSSKERGLCREQVPGASRLPCLAAPLGSWVGGNHPCSFSPSPRPPSQLLYLKLILNFLFEETK